MQPYHPSYHLPVTVLRPFNTFGPRQSAHAVIPTTMSQALAGGPVRLGSLTPRRAPTYVEDTAAGYLPRSRPPRRSAAPCNWVPAPTSAWAKSSNS